VKCEVCILIWLAQLELFNQPAAALAGWQRWRLDPGSRGGDVLCSADSAPQKPRWRPCTFDGYAPTPPPIISNRTPPKLSIPLLPPTTMARHFKLAAPAVPDRLIYFCSKIHWISEGIALAWPMLVLEL
jgi:hypothetical protein